MIILLTGASHTGKTALAQKLLEKIQLSLFFYRPFEDGIDSKRKYKADSNE